MGEIEMSPRSHKATKERLKALCLRTFVVKNAKMPQVIELIRENEVIQGAGTVSPAAMRL